MSLVLACCLLAGAPQMPLSVATTDDALSVFANPAGLGVGRGFDFCYLYNFELRDAWSNSAFCASAGPVGAFWEPNSRWGLALGAGQDGVYAGMRFSRDSLSRWDLGALWRPAPFLSIGATWENLSRSRGYVNLGVAARPLGNRLTVSCDLNSLDWLSPLVGFETEPLDGLKLAAKVKPADWSFNAGVTVGLGRAGFGAVFSRVGKRNQAGAIIRAGTDVRRSLVPPRPRFVTMRLAGAVADRKPGFSLMGGRPKQTTWELLRTIERARADRAVAGLVLELDAMQLGLAQAQEVRSALARFRESGKQVYAWAPTLGMTGCYVASAASEVAVHRLGDVAVPGMVLRTMLFKGALDKLGLEFDVLRHGKYKSAIEALVADSMSAESREQLEALADAWFGDWVSRVAEGRGLSEDSVRRLVDHGLFMSHEAAAAGLVDTFCYADELDSVLKGWQPKLRRMKEKDYARRVEYDYDWRKPGTVAIIYASGEIADGESGTDFLTGTTTLGAKTLCRAIRKAREDRRVKAILLRVDSPGGSGFASDLIWRELELTRKKKPLVVSMGNFAASGGYYIACNAEQVFADPGTLTGSIGVFGAKLVTRGLYDKVGVKRPGVVRGERAEALSDVRPYTPDEESLLQRQIDWFYRQFVEKVAEGRGMSYEAVDSVGQGRVWSGQDALGVGLVDSLGGLLEAAEWAKRQAKLGTCEFRELSGSRPGLMDRAVEGVLARLLGRQ